MKVNLQEKIELRKILSFTRLLQQCILNRRKHYLHHVLLAATQDEKKHAAINPFALISQSPILAVLIFLSKIMFHFEKLLSFNNKNTS